MNLDSCGKMVISLDFELQYGMEDVDVLESYKANILGARKIVPELLAAFEKHEIHATWAIVGMMLAQNRNDLYSYFPQNKPSYLNRELSIYENLEKVGEDEKSDPFHYGHSLVELIKKTKSQEIGTHTFCHYYCQEKGQTCEEFDSDLNSVFKIHMANNKEKVKSLVLPRNQINYDYINTVKKYGITSYRGCPKHLVYEKPSKNCMFRAIRLIDAYINLLGKKCYSMNDILNDGICDIKASCFFRPYSERLKYLEKIKLNRIKKQMLFAAKNGRVFHMWWHPHNFGTNGENNLHELDIILQYFTFLKQTYGFESKTMSEIAEEVLR